MNIFNYFFLQIIKYCIRNDITLNRIFPGPLQMVPVIRASAAPPPVPAPAPCPPTATPYQLPPASSVSPGDEVTGSEGGDTEDEEEEEGSGSDGGSSTSSAAAAGSGLVRCPTCGRVCSDPSHLANHIKLVHSSLAHKIERKKTLKCHICEKLFGRSSHLAEHIKSVHEGNKRVYQKAVCGECGRVFARKCSLNQHITAAHGIKSEVNM